MKQLYKRIIESQIQDKENIICLEDYYIIENELCSFTEGLFTEGLLNEGLLDWFKKFWKKLFKSTDDNIKMNGGEFHISDEVNQSIKDNKGKIEVEEVPYKIFSQLIKKTKSNKKEGEFNNAFKYAKENKYNKIGNHIFSINVVTKESTELIGFTFCKSQTDKEKKTTYITIDKTVLGSSINDKALSEEKIKDSLIKTIKEKHKGAEYVYELPNKEENKDDNNNLAKDIEDSKIKLSIEDISSKKITKEYKDNKNLSKAIEYFEKHKKYYTLREQEDFNAKESRNKPELISLINKDTKDCLGILFCSVEDKIEDKEIIPTRFVINYFGFVDELLDKDDKVKLSKKWVEQYIINIIEKAYIPEIIGKDIKVDLTEISKEQIKK